MTAWRAIAIGLGGAAAVVAAGVVGNFVGGLVDQASREGWPGHAALHIVFGVLVIAIALWLGRIHGATAANGLAERGVRNVRLIAFAASATAIVEGIGAYPPLEVLHNIVWANVLALLLLLLGLLFIAAVGVGRLIQGASTARSI